MTERVAREKAWLDRFDRNEEKKEWRKKNIKRKHSVSLDRSTYRGSSVDASTDRQGGRPPCKRINSLLVGGDFGRRTGLIESDRSIESDSVELRSQFREWRSTERWRTFPNYSVSGVNQGGIEL